MSFQSGRNGVHLVEKVRLGLRGLASNHRKPNADQLRIRQLEIQLQGVTDRAANAERQRDAALSEVNNLRTELIIQELDATTDDLTGASNRKAFNKFLNEVNKSIADHGYTGKGCVVALDLDRFKKINDTFGHTAGDEVLKAVVRRLQRANLVSADIKLYRLGGDEFVFVILDKRHEGDRRHQDEDDHVIRDRRNPEEIHSDRRHIGFEKYVRQAVNDVIIETVSRGVEFEHEGKLVDLDFGISEGFGFFDPPTNYEALQGRDIKDKILEALHDADTESYVRKSGIDDFLSVYEKLDDELREFVEEVFLLEYDETARGGFVIDRHNGLLASYAKPDLYLRLVGSLNERGQRWLTTDPNARGIER